MIVFLRSFLALFPCPLPLPSPISLSFFTLLSPSFFPHSRFPLPEKYTDATNPPSPHKTTLRRLAEREAQMAAQLTAREDEWAQRGAAQEVEWRAVVAALEERVTEAHGRVEALESELVGVVAAGKEEVERLVEAHQTQLRAMNEGWLAETESTQAQVEVMGRRLGAMVEENSALRQQLQAQAQVQLQAQVQAQAQPEALRLDVAGGAEGTGLATGSTTSVAVGAFPAFPSEAGTSGIGMSSPVRVTFANPESAPATAPATAPASGLTVSVQSPAGTPTRRATSSGMGGVSGTGGVSVAGGDSVLPTAPLSTSHTPTNSPLRPTPSVPMTVSSSSSSQPQSLSPPLSPQRQSQPHQQQPQQEAQQQPPQQQYQQQTASSAPHSSPPIIDHQPRGSTVTVRPAAVDLTAVPSPAAVGHGPPAFFALLDNGTDLVVIGRLLVFLFFLFSSFFRFFSSSRIASCIVLTHSTPHLRPPHPTDPSASSTNPTLGAARDAAVHRVHRLTALAHALQAASTHPSTIVYAAGAVAGDIVTGSNSGRDDESHSGTDDGSGSGRGSGMVVGEKWSGGFGGRDGDGGCFVETESVAIEVSALT